MVVTFYIAEDESLFLIVIFEMHPSVQLVEMDIGFCYGQF